MNDTTQARERMVTEQVYARGVRSPEVLTAMMKVPRDMFVSSRDAYRAYDDTPLPIGEGQTISQPYVVALMVEALRLTQSDRVLEVGTGSGYAAAVLGEIAALVYSVERLRSLAGKASQNLAAAGYENVHVRHADGTDGWAEEAPFDAILVSAGAPLVPSPLKQQLKVGGRMVIPVGSTRRTQELLRITRLDEHAFQSENLADVRFVPLIGEKGWEADDSEACVSP